MPDPGLPDQVSVALGAKIAGQPRATFRRHFIEGGLVEINYTPGGRLTVSLPSLDRALGRRITVDEYRDAERQLAPARQYQAAYRVNRRHAVRGVSVVAIAESPSNACTGT